MPADNKTQQCRWKHHLVNNQPNKCTSCLSFPHPVSEIRFTFPICTIHQVLGTCQPSRPPQLLWCDQSSHKAAFALVKLNKHLNYMLAVLPRIIISSRYNRVWSPMTAGEKGNHCYLPPSHTRHPQFLLTGMNWCHLFSTEKDLIAMAVKSSNFICTQPLLLPHILCCSCLCLQQMLAPPWNLTAGGAKIH